MSRTDGSVCMWAVTGRDHNGDEGFAGLRNSKRKADRLADRSGPGFTARLVLVGFTTELDAKTIAFPDSLRATASAAKRRLRS